MTIGRTEFEDTISSLQVELMGAIQQNTAAIAFQESVVTSTDPLDELPPLLPSDDGGGTDVYGAWFTTMEDSFPYGVYVTPGEFTKRIVDPQFGGVDFISVTETLGATEPDGRTFVDASGQPDGKRILFAEAKLVDDNMMTLDATVQPSLGFAGSFTDAAKRVWDTDSWYTREPIAELDMYGGEVLGVRALQFGNIDEEYRAADRTPFSIKMKPESETSVWVQPGTWTRRWVVDNSSQTETTSEQSMSLISETEVDLSSESGDVWLVAEVSGSAGATGNESFIEIGTANVTIAILPSKPSPREHNKWVIGYVDMAGGNINEIRQYHLGDIDQVLPFINPDCLNNAGVDPTYGTMVGDEYDRALQLRDWDREGATNPTGNWHVVGRDNDGVLRFSTIQSLADATPDPPCDPDWEDCPFYGHVGVYDVDDWYGIVPHNELDFLKDTRDRRFDAEPNNDHDYRYALLGGSHDGVGSTAGVGFYSIGFKTDTGPSAASPRINLEERRLVGGKWIVDDATVPSEASASLTVYGGVSAEKGGYIGDSSDVIAELGVSGSGRAGYFFNSGSSNSVELAGGSYAMDASSDVNVFGGDYHHEGTPGVNATVQVTQSGITRDMVISGGIIVSIT